MEILISHFWLGDQTCRVCDVRNRAQMRFSGVTTAVDPNMTIGLL